MSGTAIVTGSARGLGEAIARRLHADGFKVALADLDLGGAELVANELGEGALALRHDIRELDSWEQLLVDVRRHGGDLRRQRRHAHALSATALDHRLSVAGSTAAY